MMYFESRVQAGQILAQQLLEKYRYENVAIVALSDGGVVVGEQIASLLHCVLTMLVIEDIQIPGEGLSYGAVSQHGDFTHNSELSASDINAFRSELHGYFEEEKRQAFSRINRLIGEGGTIDYDLLRDHTVILVSDGLNNGAALDAAFAFLKPIRTERLVIAAPVASVAIVDKVHMVADELHILDVKSNYLGTDHYFDIKDVPTHEEAIARINQIILNWR